MARRAARAHSLRNGKQDDALLSFVPTELPQGITTREVDILTLTALGLTNVEIALRLGTRPRTVTTQIERLLQKLGQSGRAGLAALAVDASLIVLPIPGGIGGVTHIGPVRGGVIDTSTRFSASYGAAHRGKVAYAIGHTGLGIGASRFAADVMLDLLGKEDTERTRLEMVRRPSMPFPSMPFPSMPFPSMPFPSMPFPPEPVRALGINLTRYELARADRSQGRRGLWLKTLDALGLGFDS